MNELKKCPFCGGVAEPTNYHGKNGWFGFIRCTECFSQGRTVQFDPNDKEDVMFAYSRAIKYWNRRTNDEQV